MSTRWFNISESLNGGPDLGYIERENLDRPVTNISFIQGGWVTVPSQSDMYDTPFAKLFDGQVFNILSTGEQFIAKRFQVGINGWTDVFSNSHSFAPYTWNSSSYALTASHIIGGGGDGSGAGFPYAGSDTLGGDPAQAVITGSLLVSGSGNITASALKVNNRLSLGSHTDQYIQGYGNYLVLDADDVLRIVTDSHTGFNNKVGIGSSFGNISNTPDGLLHISGGNLIVESDPDGVGGNITASNLQVDNNINLDGTLSFDGFTFSDGNILVLSGSTTFGDSASQDTHTFTGSLYVSGGIYLTDSGSSDVKFHGTASYVVTSSHAISASYVLSSSHAISASYVESSSYALSSSYVLSSSYAFSSSKAESSSYALSSSYVLSSSNALSSSYALSSSNSFSSSYALSSSKAESSSYALSSSYVLSSSNALSSSYAFSSSKAESSSYTLSSSYALSSSYVLSSSNAFSASYALSSSKAESSSYALSSSYVLSSSHATTASYVLSSSKAESSSYALSSSYVLSSSHATTASYTLSSSHAISASNVATLQTQSDSTKIDLSNLKIVNYSTDIFTSVVDGELTLTFGIPSAASVIQSAYLSGFDTTRFNLQSDNYNLKWNINLNGATFNSGAFFRNDVQQGDFSTTENDFIGSTTKFISNDVGNARWAVRVNYTKADGTDVDISTTTTQYSISTPVPGNPTITSDFSNATPDGTSMLVSNKLEKYAGGTFDFTTSGTSNKNGWDSNPSGQFSGDTTTINVNIPSTATISKNIIENFVSNDSLQSTPLTTTTDASFTVNRMISLRTGSSTLDTIADDNNSSEIISLTDWKASVGSVVYGTTTRHQIDDITMIFNPEPTEGEYLYIVYDDNQNDLNAITNQDANTNDLGTIANPKGWQKLDSINGYKIYRSDNLNFNPTRYKVTFS